MTTGRITNVHLDIAYGENARFVLCIWTDDTPELRQAMVRKRLFQSRLAAWWYATLAMAGMVRGGE